MKRTKKTKLEKKNLSVLTKKGAHKIPEKKADLIGSVGVTPSLKQIKPEENEKKRSDLN
jgi:hypothetical protein